MKTGKIRLQRFPYEEPYHLNLVISATNGDFSGRLEFYCGVDELAEFGVGLQSFPKRIPDEHRYESGTPGAENKSAFYLDLRVSTIDKTGHCALQIAMDKNQRSPKDGACRFSIEVEPYAINRLGRLLVEFSKLKHNVLEWSVTGEDDALS